MAKKKKEYHYKLTAEQMGDIEHFQRMFDFHADAIAHLCDEERSDIEYGFELGKIHGYMRDHHMKMMKLTDKIRKQEL